MIKSIFIFRLDSEDRVGFFEEYFHNNWQYSDVISDISTNLKKNEVCLVLTPNNQVAYFCLLRKFGRVVTRRVKVKFTDIYALPKPILVDEIIKNIEKRTQGHARRIFALNAEQFPNKTKEAIIRYFHQNHKELHKELMRLYDLAQIRQDNYTAKGSQIYAQEKDAISLAMRIAGIDTSILKEWLPSKTDKAPFLKGLSRASLREDSMIIHDNQKFGNWAPSDHDQSGAIRFHSNDNLVTIMNVNRTPIEKTLGVDLLYYNHTYNSYILVQYKRMLRENLNQKKDDEDTYPREEWVYRPTDTSYHEEVERMNNWADLLSDDVVNNKLDDYRYNDELFYFKLCPSETLDLNSSTMIKGIYLPLEYWNLLLDSKVSTGPKGGKYVGYKNCKRRFNNTQFISLIQTGWIGSRQINSDKISSVINSVLDSGKSIVLAKHECLPQKPSSNSSSFDIVDDDLFDDIFSDLRER